MERDAPSQGVRLAVGAYRSTFEGQIDEALRILDDLAGLGFGDPEGCICMPSASLINGAEGRRWNTCSVRWTAATCATSR